MIVKYIEVFLWIVFIGAYVVGDVTTTYVGLKYYGLVESSPTVSMLIVEHGVATAMLYSIGVKVGVLIFAYTLHLVDYWALVIPYWFVLIIGSMLGVSAVVNNIIVIRG